MIKIWPLFKDIIVSFFDFLWRSVLLCYAVCIPITILWFYKALGSGCRYYGDTVSNCELLGLNIDWFTRMVLTPWVLPLIGIIAGPITPAFIGITISTFIWPIFYTIKIARKYYLYYSKDP